MIDFGHWSPEQRRQHLIEIRERLGMIQANLAAHLDMSLRAYSDLETGKSECRTIHLLAAERVSLHMAAYVAQPDLLTDYVKSDALGSARAFYGDRLLPPEAFEKMQAKRATRR